MTDEDLIDSLRELAATYGRGTLAFRTIQRAITRIGDAMKSPPGSIPVRIAVAIGHYGPIGVCPIYPNVRESPALTRARTGVVGEVTHQAIVTAHIPACIVPGVAGIVETPDPEATE